MKERLKKIVEKLPKDKALDFMDRYKDEARKKIAIEKRNKVNGISRMVGSIMNDIAKRVK